MKDKGYSENVSITEPASPYGVTTTIHFEGDTVIRQRSFDAEPHLRHADQMRELARYGPRREFEWVGHIPPVFYAKLLTIHDPRERQRALRAWLVEHSRFMTDDRRLKG
jgi:hypothetical protein